MKTSSQISQACGEHNRTIGQIYTDGSCGRAVPIRPICDYLDIDWSAQQRRITNDPVLSRRARSVALTATETGGGEK